MPFTAIFRTAGLSLASFELAVIAKVFGVNTKSDAPIGMCSPNK